MGKHQAEEGRKAGGLSQLSEGGVVCRIILALISQEVFVLVSANATNIRLGSCTGSTWDPSQTPTVHCSGRGPCRESRLGFIVVALDGWTQNS